MQADSWFSRHRIELGLSLRMTVAGLLSFAVAHLFQTTQVYWAVLTAVIVMQANVGGSLKAMLDRFVGTLGGAGWGVVVTVGIPHPGVLSTGLALAVSIAPARAHQALYGAARDALAAMAEQISVLLTGVSLPVDEVAVLARHDRIRAAIERAAATSDEAVRERRSYLSDAPDPEPVVRTLRRLSHDLVIISRTLAAPLPEAARLPLADPATALGAALADQMNAVGAAIAAGSPPPPDQTVSQACDAYGAAVARLRRDGVTITLPDADVERLFGLAFGLEQLRRNLDDMANRAAELARR